MHIYFLDINKKGMNNKKSLVLMGKIWKMIIFFVLDIDNNKRVWINKKVWIMKNQFVLDVNNNNINI